jgi:hypothetical protein
MRTDAVTIAAPMTPARPRPGWRCRCLIQAAAGHPARQPRRGRRRRLGLGAPAGTRPGASAIAAALGRGRRQLTPALLGVG